MIQFTIRQEFIDAIKLRLRKKNNDILDDDIQQLAQAALTDLKRVGVANIFLSNVTDPLIKEAVMTYVKANYGNNPDREKLMLSYDMLLTKIKGGRYRE